MFVMNAGAKSHARTRQTVKPKTENIVLMSARASVADAEPVAGTEKSHRSHRGGDRIHESLFVESLRNDAYSPTSRGAGVLVQDPWCETLLLPASGRNWHAL